MVQLKLDSFHSFRYNHLAKAVVDIVCWNERLITMTKNHVYTKYIKERVVLKCNLLSLKNTNMSCTSCRSENIKKNGHTHYGKITTGHNCRADCCHVNPGL